MEGGKQRDLSGVAKRGTLDSERRMYEGRELRLMELSRLRCINKRTSRRLVGIVERTRHSGLSRVRLGSVCDISAALAEVRYAPLNGRTMRKAPDFRLLATLPRGSYRVFKSRVWYGTLPWTEAGEPSWRCRAIQGQAKAAPSALKQQGLPTLISSSSLK